MCNDFIVEKKFLIGFILAKISYWFYLAKKIAIDYVTKMYRLNVKC